MFPAIASEGLSSLWYFSGLHQDAARVLLLGRGVEHLALCAQVGALGHQVVEFLAALKDLSKVSGGRHVTDGMIEVRCR